MLSYRNRGTHGLSLSPEYCVLQTVFSSTSKVIFYEYKIVKSIMTKPLQPTNSQRNSDLTEDRQTDHTTITKRVKAGTTLSFLNEFAFEFTSIVSKLS